MGGLCTYAYRGHCRYIYIQDSICLGMWITGLQDRYAAGLQDNYADIFDQVINT